MNEQILKRLTTRTLILFAALLCMPLSHAGTNLAPVILEINENARTTLTITNNSDRRVPYQLSLLSWTQANGEDVLAPSDSLVTAPQLFRLRLVQAGKSALVFGMPTRKEPKKQRIGY
jgi:fimbrial chaperone protein